MPSKKTVAVANDTIQVKRKMFKGGAFVVFFTVLAAPFGYFIRMVFSRSLSIEMYGLLYAMVSFVGIFTTYNDLGFGYSLTYLVPKYFKKKAYWVCWTLFTYERYIEVVTAGILSAGLIFFSPWLAEHYFKVPEARIVIIIFCVYFMAWAYLSAVHQFFVGLRQDGIHMSIQPLVLFLTFVFALISYLTDHGTIYFYAFSWAMAYVVTAIVYTVINHRKNRYLAQKPVTWNSKIFREMLNFAIPTLLTSTIFTFITSVDTLLLTLFRGVAEVGIYNIIIPVTAIPAILFSPLDGFLFPYISHFAEGEKEKITSILFTTQHVISFLALYTGIFIALFPSLIVAILFGDKWQGLTEQPLRLYALFFVIFTMTSHLNMVVSGVGRVKERLRASTAIAILDVAVGVVLIYRFGVMGAVITNIVINIFSMLLYLRIIQMEVVVDFPWKQFLKGAILTAFFFAIKSTFHIQPRGLIDLFVTGFIYTLLFFPIAYFAEMLPIDKKLVADGWEILNNKLRSILIIFT